MTALLRYTGAGLGSIRREAPTRPTVTAMARPTYATALVGQALIPRPASFQLLHQFWSAIPAIPRAVDILCGLVGEPTLKIPDDDAGTKDLQQWAESVAYGEIGTGLGSWLLDHLGQVHKYGFGIGEYVAAASRRDVERLWSYGSEAFGFRTDPQGHITVLQYVAGERTLNPETTLSTTRGAQGCNPNGTPLFFASMTFSQAWLDIAHAYRSTVRRNGIPIYWFNWVAPEGFNDMDGSKSNSIAAAIETNWNACMKSQAVDGTAMDLFTAGGGDTKLQIIGVDGQIIDIQVSKRAIVEEIVVASGLPAWMLGYTWSSTERLSTQQADVLTANVHSIRRLAEPALFKVINARQRLLGKKPKTVEIHWKDVNLQDLEATSRAAALDAQALRTRQQIGRQLWQDGVYNQAQYAEFVTGSEVVAMALTEPPALQSPVGAPAGSTNGLRLLTLPDVKRTLNGTH